jgi:hypothetical protein
MAERPKGFPRGVAAIAFLILLILGAGIFIWRDDIMRTGLDPKEPFQTYDPPAAPNYAVRDAWALLPAKPEATAVEPLAADVFFVGPTTYDGGDHWNAPPGDPKAARLFARVMAPNYAGPFVRVGRIFAPRYRQASLYSLLTLREDAKEARRFAYGDVAVAFRYYLDHYNHGRPFLIVGVEQGGTLSARLLSEEVATRPDVRAGLVAAYLVETVVPADAPPIRPCMRRQEAGCLAAWASAPVGEPERAQAILDRSLVWKDGQLENLHGRIPLCFNPILGATTEAPAPAKAHLGAANATGLEWGARPAFLSRQVSARCEHGVLRVSRPKSASLKPTGSWADRRKAPPYNLFYADLEADAKARLAAVQAPTQPSTD